MQRFGSKNSSAKLTEAQATNILTNRHGEPARVWAERYGVSESCILFIQRRTTWPHITRAA